MVVHDDLPDVYQRLVLYGAVVYKCLYFVAHFPEQVVLYVS